MTDPTKRRANWEAKYNTERIKQVLDAKRADMGARYEAAVAAMCIMETKVRETINACGVSCRLPLKTDPFVPLKSDPPS
jgi:hypothetical protein